MSNEYFALDANVAALAQAFGEDMGDVKRRILKDATTFPTRAEMVAALSSLSDSPDGAVVWAEGQAYKRNSSANYIYDLPGWEAAEQICAGILGITPSGEAEDNNLRLSHTYANGTPEEIYFEKAGEYKFTRLLPTSGWKHRGVSREQTILSFPADENGIVCSGGNSYVEWRDLAFTQNFDRKDHKKNEGGPGSGDQRALVVGHSGGGNHWVFENCRFFNTARQAIFFQGPSVGWRISGCLFKELSREGVFFKSDSQGTGEGVIVTDNVFDRCGDDVFNFRNYHSCVFSNNYVNAVNEDLNPGAGPGKTADAGVKIHGDGNTVIGNVFKMTGSRAIEIRGSSPIGSQGGAPRGNVVIGNSFLSSGTHRGTGTAAILFSTVEGGINIVAENYIRWEADSPAIRLYGQTEGWPESLPEPEAASNVIVRNNIFENVLVPLRVRTNSRFNKVEITGNKFHEVSNRKLIEFVGTDAKVVELKFSNNDVIFVPGDPLSEIIDMGDWSNRVGTLELSGNSLSERLRSFLTTSLSAGQYSDLKAVITDNSFELLEWDTRISRAARGCFYREVGGLSTQLVFVSRDGGSAFVPVSKRACIVSVSNAAESGVAHKFFALFNGRFQGARSFAPIGVGSRTTIVTNKDFDGMTATGDVTIAVNEGQLGIYNGSSTSAVFRVSIS